MKVKGAPKVLGFVEGPGYPEQSGIGDIACNAVRATGVKANALHQQVSIHPYNIAT